MKIVRHPQLLATALIRLSSVVAYLQRSRLGVEIFISSLRQ